MSAPPRPRPTNAQIAKYLFIANAALVSVGYSAFAAALAALYSTHAPWLDALVFAGPFLLGFGGGWSWFCRSAYRGMRSDKARLNVVFWLFMVCNATMIVFPVGLAFSCAVILLWRAMKKEDASKT